MNVLQILYAGFQIGLVYALIALGLNLMYGTMRLLNIAHGDLMMIGAYVAYWCFTFYGLSPLLSLFLVALICGGLGILFCKYIFVSVMETSESAAALESNSLLLFYGVGIIIPNIVSLLCTADIRGYSYMTQTFDLGGMRIMLNRLLVLIISAVICLLCYLGIQFTTTGKAIRALIQDREAAQYSGIDIRKTYFICFFLGFTIAGMAGCFISMFYEINPFMGMEYTITAFIVIVLGGLGNLLGSLLGGVLLGIIETFIMSFIPGLSPVIRYGLFTFIILYRPQGILGKGIY